LPGNGSHEIEIAIVVQHGQARALRDRRDQQVRESYRPVFALARKLLHHVNGAIEVGLSHRYEPKCERARGAGSNQVGIAAGAVEDLQLDDTAGSYVTGKDEGSEDGADRRVAEAGEGALISDIARS
jgi:hypothetical protein